MIPLLAIPLFLAFLASTAGLHHLLASFIFVQTEHVSV
jgi:hypothetical protein